MGTPARGWFGTTQVIGRKAINVSSSGATTLVPAVPGYRIVVLKYKVITSDVVAVSFLSSGGRLLDGPCTHGQYGGVQAPHDEHGHFQTDIGEALQISLGSAVQVGGSLTYGVI